MNSEYHLFMLLLGCRPKGRLTEQHDIFFSIGRNLQELIPQIRAFWPEAKGRIHIDAWRKVNMVDGFRVYVIDSADTEVHDARALYFVNAGGYRCDEFEEYHYKMLMACDRPSEAISRIKKTDFFNDFNFKGAASHIDDKYGIDVYDLHLVSEILPGTVKGRFSIRLIKDDSPENDPIHLGYLKLDKVKLLNL